MTPAPTLAAVPLPPNFAERYHQLDTTARRAARRRDEYVAKVLAAGATLREAAAALGMSHTMVAKIAARAKKATP